MKKVIFNKYRMLTAQAPLWRLHSLTAGVLARSYTTEFRNLQQGGRLVVDMTAFDSASLKISSAWQDHCTLELGSEAEADALEIFEVADDNTLSIAASQRSASNQDAPQLSIFIPEYFDVHIRANQIDLELLKKIQGDVSVTAQSGSVRLDKVRGESLQFDCGSAAVQVRKALEGDIRMRCGSLSAKMVHSSSFDCAASGLVSIEALYGDTARINASDSITVGGSAGSIEAESSSGNISISGVDGQFHLRAPRGSIEMQINKIGAVPSAADAGKQVVAAIDPEIAASIRCESASHASTRALVSIVSDAFELSEEHQAADGPAVNLPRVGMYEGGVISGFLTGRSTGLKRPQFLTGSSQSGKIDLKGAEASWIGNEARASDSYDITLRAEGNIRIETLSWIEIIRRKHGFDSTDVLSTKTDSLAGRTASAKLRAAELLAESQKRSES